MQQKDFSFYAKSQKERGGENKIMNTIQKKVISFIATAALMANTSIPALAVTLEISGNGPDSDNTTYVDVTNSTTVTQTNVANIDNDVDATASTGGNEVEKSTGGDVSVETGDATTDVTVVNSVNSNQASVEGCGTCAADVEVLISGNGPDSDNKVDLDVNSESGSGTALFQSNTAWVDNNVDAESKTGGNEVDKATGGDVEIDTGDASTTVTVDTSANANSAVLGGGGEGGLVSLKILGNGPDTDNDIYLDLDREVLLVQDNFAHVDNDVDAESSTGKNEIEESTGGAAIIETGDAETTVEVDNMVNFNWADVECDGCLWDVTGKIAGNGPDTDNKIKADLEDSLAVFQDNCGEECPWLCKVDNDVDAEAKTGWNEMDEVTGGVLGGDPSVDTGDAATTVEVGNSGNANVYGEAPEWDVEMPFDFNLNLTLDLSELLAFLNLS